MGPQVLQLPTHQRPPFESADRHEADLAVRELQHLERFREFDQFHQIVGEDLFGTDIKIYGKTVRPENAFVGEVLCGTDTRDPRGDIEQVRRELACHQIRFIALRDCNQHVGILDPGIHQDRRMRGASGHRPQVVAILQHAQPRLVDIDDRDIVLLRNQALSQRSPDATGTKNDNFQEGSPPAAVKRGLNVMTTRNPSGWLKSPAPSACGKDACAQGRFFRQRGKSTLPPGRDDE